MRWPNHMRCAKVRPLLRLASLSHQMWQHFLLKRSVLWVLLAIFQFTSVNQVSKCSPAFCQQSKEIVLNAILVKSLLRADWTTWTVFSWCYFLKVKCCLGASIFSVHIFLKKKTLWSRVAIMQHVAWWLVLVAVRRAAPKGQTLAFGEITGAWDNNCQNR